MKVGVIGLGRMGNPIAKKFYKSGCQVTVYDENKVIRQEFENYGIHVSKSIADLSAISDVIWLMVPSEEVDSVLDHLCGCMQKNTVVIDGGNSYFKDTIRRSKFMNEKEMHFLDCGTSGGLWGTEHGFSLTIGGEFEIFKKVETIFELIVASKNSYCYVGPSGSGHYVKMVHNGIEYALMQSYAEGFHLLHQGYYKNLDLATISNTWNEGAVIRSWILELIHEIFVNNQDFTNIKGIIGEHGTGRWAVQEAHKEGVKVKLIEDAVNIRKESQKTGGNYATKLVALIRHKMGGHNVEQTSCLLCGISDNEE